MNTEHATPVIPADLQEALFAAIEDEWTRLGPNDDLLLVADRLLDRTVSPTMLVNVAVSNDERKWKRKARVFVGGDAKLEFGHQLTPEACLARVQMDLADQQVTTEAVEVLRGMKSPDIDAFIQCLSDQEHAASLAALLGRPIPLPGPVPGAVRTRGYRVRKRLRDRVPRPDQSHELELPPTNGRITEDHPSTLAPPKRRTEEKAKAGDVRSLSATAYHEQQRAGRSTGSGAVGKTAVGQTPAQDIAWVREERKKEVGYAYSKLLERVSAFLRAHWPAVVRRASTLSWEELEAAQEESMYSRPGGRTLSLIGVLINFAQLCGVEPAIFICDIQQGCRG
jgi:hypothetical protein